MTNHRRNPGNNIDSNESGMPQTMQGEENRPPHTGHQRANTTHISSQSKANETNFKLSNKASSKHFNKKHHKGQHNLVTRPAQIKQRKPKSTNTTRRYCQFKLMTHRNQRTRPRSVAQKQQPYLAQVLHSAAYQSNSTITSVKLSHLWSWTQTQDQLRIKLGAKTFEYYFEIIKNLKQDLILGLNFSRTFKILQDVTDDNDLYLHIKRKIVTFSQQAKNTTNHISTHKCIKIKPKSFKQFEVKAPKGLKNGAVYEIDYKTKGIPEDIIPVLDTFIAGKCQKFIRITLINLSDETKWIPQGQHISTVHLVEGRMPSEEEAQEIIHQLRVHPQEVNKMNTGNTDDFITSNDQVQMNRPVQHQEKQTLSPEMKRKLHAIIDDYLDIFSKSQYDISQSTHPPVEIPTEGPPCISAPYTIPLKFRPWVDNTINKLLEAGMIQRTMSTWASPIIIVSKKD